MRSVHFYPCWTFLLLSALQSYTWVCAYFSPHFKAFMETVNQVMETYSTIKFSNFTKWSSGVPLSPQLLDVRKPLASEKWAKHTFTNGTYRFTFFSPCSSCLCFSSCSVSSHPLPVLSVGVAKVQESSEQPMCSWLLFRAIMADAVCSWAPFKARMPPPCTV